MIVCRLTEGPVPTYVMDRDWTVLKIEGMALLVLDSGTKVTLRSAQEIKQWCNAPAGKVGKGIKPTATELIEDLLLNVVETYAGEKLTKNKVKLMLVTDKRQLGLEIGLLLKELNLLPTSHKK